MVNLSANYTPNRCIAECRNQGSSYKYCGLTGYSVSNMFFLLNDVPKSLCVIIYTRGCACVGGSVSVFMVWRWGVGCKRMLRANVRVGVCIMKINLELLFNKCE